MVDELFCVEFKVRFESDDALELFHLAGIDWESLPIAHVQWYGSTREQAIEKASDKAAEILFHLGKAEEVRWNFKGESEGNYINIMLVSIYE